LLIAILIEATPGAGSSGEPSIADNFFRDRAAPMQDSPRAADLKSLG
jgi:hypothetical protein